ncbi:hypothetical protein ANN_08259 [Periplaneta americana]|uniref:Uncharacterized protein n=1 Tax=Periplaneta americana TaxID=6978 RepID=A0ABQ8T2F9_PERAM|nr:hypothetical protein ANN_08259 [Periplaneta americana]
MARLCEGGNEPPGSLKAASLTINPRAADCPCTQQKRLPLELDPEHSSSNPPLLFNDDTNAVDIVIPVQQNRFLHLSTFSVFLSLRTTCTRPIKPHSHEANEAWFSLSGYVNSQNMRHYASVNPHEFLEELQMLQIFRVTCSDRESNPDYLVSRPDALTVTQQVWTDSKNYGDDNDDDDDDDDEEE